MEIRKLELDDFEASIALFQYAFQITFTEEQMQFEKSRFQSEATWGAFEDGMLQAQVAVVPLEMYINGQSLSMGGVANVSSWPEQRRKGSVAKLITRTLQAMKESGQTISALAPFSFSFYRKYGWELYTDYKKYTIETPLLPPRVEYEGHMERRDGEVSLLNEIYNTYAKRYNGMLVRTDNWLEKSVLRRKKGHTAVYFNPNGEPTAYTIYEIKQGEMTVHELVALDEPARKAIWTFLSNHDSMIQRAVVTAPMNDVLPYLIANPRIKQEIIPYFMARIVDVKSFLELYAFTPSNEDTKLSIEIIDPHAPWNEGMKELVIHKDGSGFLQAAELSLDPDLKCDIQTATAMFLGYKRPAELSNFQKLSGSAEAVQALERVIPIRTTYLLDFF